MQDQLSLLDSDETDDLLALDPVEGEASGYNLFLALFPSPEVARQIAIISANLRKQHGLRGSGLDPSRLHVTLHVVERFGRRVPRSKVEAAHAAAASVRWPRFPVRFDRAMSFDNSRAKRENNPYILRCDGNSDAQIARLRQALAVSLRRNGLHPAPTMTPHMTLVYDRQVIAEQQIEPFAWEATRFALILSHVGLTHHQWIGEWQLV